MSPQAEHGGGVGDETLVGRSYTRARRYPLVIGKLPNGGRIPGGPYTLTQLGVMVGAFLLLVGTRGLWAHFGLVNLVLLVGVPYGLAWGVRHARVEGRDPARAALGLLVLYSQPRTGRLAGNPIRRVRPVALRTRFTVTELSSPDGAAPQALVAAPSVPVVDASSAPGSRLANGLIRGRDTGRGTARPVPPVVGGQPVPGRRAAREVPPVPPVAGGRPGPPRSRLQELLDSSGPRTPVRRPSPNSHPPQE